MHKTIFIITTLIFFTTSSCDLILPEGDGKVSVSFTELDFLYITLGSGPSSTAYITGQAAYENFIYNNFTAPLLQNGDYTSSGLVYAILEQNHSLSYADALIEAESIYSTLKADSSAGVNYFPEVDFGKYDLLVYEITASGCSRPELEPFLLKNPETREYLFKLLVETVGLCEMAVSNHVAIKTGKLREDYKVVFEHDFIN